MQFRAFNLDFVLFCGESLPLDHRGGVCGTRGDTVMLVPI